MVVFSSTEEIPLFFATIYCECPKEFVYIYIYISVTVGGFIKINTSLIYIRIKKLKI